MSKQIIFGFDVGVASLGEAIRVDDDIIHAQSLLIPAEFASTKKAAERRRMSRTRQAHKAREYWLNKICIEAGIPVLKEIEEDERTGRFVVKFIDSKLLREFPEKGDDTLYTSSLLRIQLLENPEKLEPWQVYKALHSAIQKRGYGEVVWKIRSSSSGKDGKKEVQITESRISNFEQALKEMSENSRHHYCCYFDAWKMGLWTPTGGIIAVRQTHLAEKAALEHPNDLNEFFGGYTPPRSIVENELRALLQSAKQKFTSLDIDYVLYGPGRKEGASYCRETSARYNLKRGRKTDWQGVLSQKVPRFDNRILSKCVLMPARNTCKANCDEQKAFHFLQQLHNLKVIDSNGENRRLSFDEFKRAWMMVSAEKKFTFGRTPAQLKKMLKTVANATPVDSRAEIPKPRENGRSRFCKPALRILKDFYLSGLEPKEFYEELKKRPSGNHALTIESNLDRSRGLTLDDLEWLKTVFNRTWQSFSIPDHRYESLAQQTDAESAIQELIGSVGDPIVRHRLSIFLGRIKALSRIIQETSGRREPDLIMIEFVREDWMGETQRKQYLKWVREREKENQEAKRKVAEHRLGRRGSLRYQLAKEQGFIDLYSGKKFGVGDLDAFEIDHIVPRELGGPDAIYNKVLTSRECNQAKGRRVPYEWLRANGERWEKYLTLLDSPELNRLSPKKKKLLIDADASELVQKYSALAETAWIAKLTQTIVHLFFGWQRGAVDQKKRVKIVSGGLTAKMRRKYRLNQILGEKDSPLEKDRSDKRHHALDAMVISFLAEWARDPAKSDYLKFPKGVDASFFEFKLRQIFPRQICRAKPELEENFYGLREGKFVVKRFSVLSLAYKTENMKSRFDVKSLQKNIRSIYPQSHDLLLRLNEELERQKVTPSEQSWKIFCQNLRGSNGARVKFLSIIDNNIDQASNLSADSYGGEYKLLAPPFVPVKQVLKPKGVHKGQIVYWDGKKFQIQPIYAHESKHQSIRNLLRDHPEREIVSIFQSGDIVSLKTDYSENLARGFYRLNSLYATGACVLTTVSGQKVKGNPRIWDLITRSQLTRVT